MTEIKRLLNEVAMEEFDEIMYGDDNGGGLYDMLPIGITFSDVTIECICSLLLLEQTYNLEKVTRFKLYKMYRCTIDFIRSEYGDLQLAGRVFFKNEFIEFMDTYFPYWQKPNIKNSRTY